jgi:hypothetical protein
MLFKKENHSTFHVKIFTDFYLHLWHWNQSRFHETQSYYEVEQHLWTGKRK